jgi:LysM repeat protein
MPLFNEKTKWLKGHIMNNRKLYPVMLLIAVAIGTGVGVLISKPKIDKQKEEIERIKRAKVQSEEAIKRATEKIVRYEKEIARTENVLKETMAELAKASQQLTTMTSPVSESSEPVVVITTQSDRLGTEMPTVDYTVKEGDSLWKIAQEQLGNGDRYKEILRVNPGLSEDQTLDIGTKIKIPTQ